MPNIDYSKWDRMKFDEDISSGEEESAGSGMHTPRSQPSVTRLDQPSRITRTAGGELHVHTLGPAREYSESATAKSPATVTSKEPVQIQSSSGTDIFASFPESWTEKGGECNAVVADGQVKLLWSQDRHTVTLRLVLQDGACVQGWNCRVKNVLDFKDRNCAVGSCLQTLEIHLNESIWLRDELPHAVHLDEEEDSIDWCIQRWHSIPYIVVNLRKAVPMQEVTMWWKQPLKSCPEISLTWREADQERGFQRAWKEAHELFHKQVDEKQGRVIE
jgi:hypothetical protein